MNGEFGVEKFSDFLGKLLCFDIGLSFVQAPRSVSRIYCADTSSIMSNK